MSGWEFVNSLARARQLREVEVAEEDVQERDSTEPESSDYEDEM